MYSLDSYANSTFVSCKIITTSDMVLIQQQLLLSALPLGSIRILIIFGIAG